MTIALSSERYDITGKHGVCCFWHASNRSMRNCQNAFQGAVVAADCFYIHASRLQCGKKDSFITIIIMAM